MRMCFSRASEAAENAPRHTIIIHLHATKTGPMSTSPADLQARRDAMKDRPQNTDKRTERVWKMFTDKEKAAAIKSTNYLITIGSGNESREVIVRPLNPKQMIESYTLLRDILSPLIKLFEPSPDGRPKDISISSLVNALGDNVEKIPILVYAILKRGNDISLDWIENHLDIIIDLQLLIPAFLEQNALGKLLGNAPASVAPTPKDLPESIASPQTEASPAQ
jgi:hypothetical protein